MSLEVAFSAYENQRLEGGQGSLSRCLALCYHPQPPVDEPDLSADQSLELKTDRPKGGKGSKDSKQDGQDLAQTLETLLLAHPHILAAPEAKVRALRKLSSGGTLRSEADLLLAYQIAATAAARKAAADVCALGPEWGVDYDAALLGFMAQGLEAQRAQSLVESLRIKRLYYRAKRPGLGGVLRRGKDLSEDELRTLASLPHSDILRRSQSMVWAVMQFDRPELADGRIASLFDFIVACKSFFELIEELKKNNEVNMVTRRAIQAFVMANFDMPLTLGQLPRVVQEPDALIAHYTLDTPFGDQGQRASFVADELREQFFLIHEKA